MELRELFDEHVLLSGEGFKWLLLLLLAVVPQLLIIGYFTTDSCETDEWGWK